MTSALLLLLAAPQDLFERDAALRRRLSPDVRLDDVRARKAGLEIGASLDFACGSFDWEASFRSLFNKNVAEEFLGGALASLQAELAQSPLVLACYASPTVCDALKHYRVTANSMLGMEFDACRAVEQGLDDVQRRLQARAVKECLEQQARRGVPLDEAQKACAGARTFQGLDGRATSQADLRRDLDLEGALVPDLRVGAGTIRADARPEAVARAYEAKREERIRAWEQALREPAKSSLEGLGPVSRGDVERLALVDPPRREVAVRSLAAVQALADLMREIHETERTLESGELRATPEVRSEMERRRTQLRSEMGRLLERFEMEERVGRAIGGVRSAAEADVAEKARLRLGERRAREAQDHALDRTRPWGCDVKPTKGDGDAGKRKTAP